MTSRVSLWKSFLGLFLIVIMVHLGTVAFADCPPYTYADTSVHCDTGGPGEGTFEGQCSDENHNTYSTCTDAEVIYNAAGQSTYSDQQTCPHEHAVTIPVDQIPCWKSRDCIWTGTACTPDFASVRES